MRTLTVNINNRCPLRCRHCSIGFSEEYRGDTGTITCDELQRIIRSLDRQVYGMVLMAGGEPSLNPELIRAGIDAARERGVLSAIVTSPIWGASADTAERFLARIQGLDMLILSYDDYHLEFLRLSHYRFAALAALRRGVSLVFQVAYAADAERDRLIESLAGLKALAQVHPMRTVMIGNAHAGVANAEYVTVARASDLDAIPRGCVLGNAFVDRRFAVHGCCWSTAAERSPFTVASNGNAESLAAAFQQLEAEPVFRAVRPNGFIAALTDRGRETVATLVRGERFASECDLCMRMMRDETRHVWEECAQP